MMNCYLIKQMNSDEYYYAGPKSLLEYTYTEPASWLSEKDCRFCLINNRETASNLMNGLGKLGRMNLQLLEVQITKAHYDAIQEELRRAAKVQAGMKP